ncbi:MAG: hypothetical protein WD649_05380 [Thermoleophilaceae bacterium]
MKAVNLLPEEYRPRVSKGDRAGGAYVVLGVLGAVLVAVVVYVLTLNQIGSREDAIAEAKRETAAAEARSQALKPVANFLQVKEQREQSVKQLASERFDWERLVLELSRVMPNGVYLISTTTSLTGSEAAGGGSASGSSQSGTPTAPGAASTTPPKMTLLGCAPSQDAVAAMLVRLRRLHNAVDVTLTKSADEAGGTASSQSSSSSTSSSSSATPAPGGEENQCKSREYEFEASVVFEPVAVAGALAKPDDKVPASLGGGQ